MNAVERIEYLFDEFQLVSLPNGTFLFGIGEINKRKVYFVVFNRDGKPNNDYEDFKNLNNFLLSIEKEKAPLILLLDIPAFHNAAQKSQFPDSPDKLLASKFGVGRWYHSHSILSGKIPQVCVVFDKMGSALTFPITLSDVAIMSESAGMSIGRLDVVSEILHEKIGYDELGSASMHYLTSGSVDFVEKTEEDALNKAKNYLSYVPDFSGMALPYKKFSYSNKNAIKALIPENPMQFLDMDELIDVLADDSSFFELRAGYAKEIITGFATIEGNICGIIANRSSINGGIFFEKSSQKTARFVSLCDAFGIPLIFLADTAGFMVGSKMEKNGIIKSASLLFSTIANASTAKMSVCVRRGYTAGLYAMAGGGMMADYFVGLPSCNLTIYGEFVAHQLIKNATDKEKQKALEMIKLSHHPNYFLKEGMLDKIIDYDKLRSEIAGFIKHYQDGKRASKRPVLVV